MHHGNLTKTPNPQTECCVVLSAFCWAAVFVQLEVEWPRAFNQVQIPFSYPSYGFDGAGFKGIGWVDTGRASRLDFSRFVNSVNRYNFR